LKICFEYQLTTQGQHKRRNDSMSAVTVNYCITTLLDSIWKTFRPWQYHKNIIVIFIGLMWLAHPTETMKWSMANSSTNPRIGCQVQYIMTLTVTIRH